MNLHFAEERLPEGTMCATIGFFDGVHLGHLHTLNMVRLQAAACGLTPMVVTFEQHPQHILHPEQPPVAQIMTATDRMMWLEQAGVSDVLVLEFTNELAAMTSTEFMRLLHDHYGVARLIVGFNNRFGSDRSSTFDDYKRAGAALGVTVLQASRNPHGPVSSSMIRDLIANDGDVRRAALLLGRHFYVGGKVVHGNHVGSQLGFPTANVGEMNHYQLMPAAGAYAVYAHLIDENGENELSLPGMAGVGHRPTFTAATHPCGQAKAGFHNEGGIGLEVNLFGYDGGDLYGKDITVFFVDRIRDEIKFDSTDGLRAQLEQDREAAENILREHFPNA